MEQYSLPGGLKGTHGLFGSSEWWENIAQAIATVVRLEGRIGSLYSTGMHNESQGFEMLKADGSTYRHACAANDKKDLALFRIGKKIVVVYVVEELRNPVKSGNEEQRSCEQVLEILLDE